MPSLRRNIDPQRDSNKLSGSESLPLPFGRRAGLDTSLVLRQPSLTAAIVLCVQISGFDRKRVYGALGIDAATWSRVESGQANFPVNQLQKLMDVCGNEAPLIWLVNACGYDWDTLRVRQSETERQLAQVMQENSDLKRLIRLRHKVESTLE